MRQLPDYKPSFPHWSATDLRNHVPTLDDDGIELLQLMLTYDTAKRISGTFASEGTCSLVSSRKLTTWPFLPLP